MPLFFLFLFVAIAVSACSNPADVSDMVYTVPEKNKVTKTSRYYQNIEVEKVTGGSETSFYTDTKISNTQLKEAIEQSLQAANMQSTSSNSTYHLTAEIADLQQQSFGESPKTEVHIKFTLQNKKTKATVFAETYTNDNFATNKDALRRGKKVEIATERAVQGAIHKLLDRLLM
ncbi:hypothetical protein [Candidatus Odyssella acanthamoebae]|uniref:Lipoprotein n=1 Tax=Candidatus Odyssella acanthamoebae TaxID=91604 RepID=A0A077AZJ7_9PROT|nr:hypothetical protein [Candidatus Paracaedibacter acanthamoebae]AIK96160.1 hypothetical protein ID47_04495 [Candidatus Paracaedibacter acanthamoebae]